MKGAFLIVTFLSLGQAYASSAESFNSLVTIKGIEACQADSSALKARGFSSFLGGVFKKGKDTVGSVVETGKNTVETVVETGKDTVEFVYDTGKDSVKMVSVLNTVLSDIAKVQVINTKGGRVESSEIDLSDLSKRDIEGDEELVELMKRGDTVEYLLTKVFVALKRSGLIMPIIKMSLTNEDIRAALIDMTIQLLEADVIPYEDIFYALKDSGLALQVVGFSLQDDCTRRGLGKLIVELIPELINSGALDPRDIIRRIIGGDKAIALLEESGAFANSTIFNQY